MNVIGDWSFTYTLQLVSEQCHSKDTASKLKLVYFTLNYAAMCQGSALHPFIDRSHDECWFWKGLIICLVTSNYFIAEGVSYDAVPFGPEVVSEQGAGEAALHLQKCGSPKHFSDQSCVDNVQLRWVITSRTSHFPDK